MKYFNQKTDPKLACTCGNTKCEYKDNVENHIDKGLQTIMDVIRLAFGMPLIVNSGLRCKYHPIAKKKKNPGAHQQGKAVDFAMPRDKASQDYLFAVLCELFEKGKIKGFGIANSFFHIDVGHDFVYRPHVWKYGNATKKTLKRYEFAMDILRNLKRKGAK